MLVITAIKADSEKSVKITYFSYNLSEKDQRLNRLKEGRIFIFLIVLMTSGFRLFNYYLEQKENNQRNEVKIHIDDESNQYREIGIDEFKNYLRDKVSSENMDSSESK
ncbi:MAG: hypothetical protein R2753_10745 [Chitinophagales bacterium]